MRSKDAVMEEVIIQTTDARLDDAEIKACMDAWAKEVAIEFAEYLNGNYTMYDGADRWLEIDGKINVYSTQKLFTMFLKEKNTIQKQ